MTTPKRSALAGWRDATLFLTGLCLIIYEAVVHTGPERWGLLMLYAGMVGSPVFLSLDERRQASSGRPPIPPTPQDAAPEDV